MSDSLQSHGLYSPWNSPGQDNRVGVLALLQGIFPTQESNQGLMCCRQILYQLSYQGSPQGRCYIRQGRQVVSMRISCFIFVLVPQLSHCWTIHITLYPRFTPRALWRFQILPEILSSWEPLYLTTLDLTQPLKCSIQYCSCGWLRTLFLIPEMFIWAFFLASWITIHPFWF